MDHILTNESTKTANYGIDAPNVVRNFLLLGVLLIATSFYFPAPLEILAHVLFYWGIVTLGISLAMLAYARVGKLYHRDRLLNFVHWTGKENVLDVGTGRGLLMIGAAKRLTSGKATGIDIWNQEDLSANKIENTLNNIEVEGVKLRTEVLKEDVQLLSFQDDSFDVVLSNLCLHNIQSAQGRQKACMEMARVLKTKGKAVISDMRYVKEYEKTFKELNFSTEIKGPLFFTTFPALSVLIAEKK